MVRARMRSMGAALRLIASMLSALLIATSLAGPASAGRGGLTSSRAAPPLLFGPAVVTLHGPWRFRIGDDPTYSDPATSDATWEKVDLATVPTRPPLPPGAPPLTPGWSARGHVGDAGVAWYRLTVRVDTQAPLAIAGPSSADGPYQIFVNGQLIGGAGDFSPGRPTAHRALPTAFLIPAPEPGSGRIRTLMIAIRAWSPPELIGERGGGLRAAPILGLPDGVAAFLREQRQAVFQAHAIDPIETIAFLGLMALAGGLLAIKPRETAYRALIAALGALALYQANECLYQLTAVEDVTTYQLVRTVILLPASLVLWILAWRGWLRGRLRRWLSLDLTLMLAGVAGVSMALGLGSVLSVNAGALSHGFFVRGDLGVKAALLLIYAIILAIGLWKNATWANLTAAAAASVLAVFLFGDELAVLGLAWDWRPFGAEVSPAQLAELVFAPLMLAAMILRFVDFAKGTVDDDDDLEMEDLWGEVPGHEIRHTPVLSRTPFWRMPSKPVESANSEEDDDEDTGDSLSAA